MFSFLTHPCAPQSELASDLKAPPVPEHRPVLDPGTPDVQWLAKALASLLAAWWCRRDVTDEPHALHDGEASGEEQ